MRYTETARTLGGCPENLVGGRFKVLSILTTATQLNYVNELCNPTRSPTIDGAAIDRLLPTGMNAAKAVTGDVAGEIAAHQYKLFLGRPPNDVEHDEAVAAGVECAAGGGCSAEAFARPLCFALLSSSDLLFY